jgi:hypothetical protein
MSIIQIDYGFNIFAIKGKVLNVISVH